MSPRNRRLAAAGVVAAVVAVVVAASRPAEPPPASFRVVLGLKDKEPTDWSGQGAVADGEAVELKGWRFEEMDAVEGTAKWKCKTREYIAPGERFPLDPASGKPPPPQQEPWPNGVVLTVRGADPTVTLTLPAGEVKFKASDVPLGQPKTFLDGQVRVERLPATSVLRPPAEAKDPAPVQDDYPAFWVRYKTGKQYLAWVAYQKEKDRVLLAERDGPEGAWSDPVEVAGPGDHFRVALAGAHDDTVWVVWSSQRDHNWDLYGRPYKDGKLGDEVRLTDDPGPDLWHRMTTDQRGRAWVVWQGARDGKFVIFARCAEGGRWGPPVRVSESKADEWNPVICSDPKADRVWVAWDSYQSGAYNVDVTSLSGGSDPKHGEFHPPQNSPLFQAHPSLACDHDGRLWVAWDEAGPSWGKDYGFLYFKAGGEPLYARRAVRLRCLIDGQWKEPEADLYSVIPDDMKEYDELPQLQDDGEGRMWLAFRHRTCRHPRIDGWAIQGRWDNFATAWLGDRWTTPVELPQSGGRNDMRPDSQRDPSGNVYFAYASDNRGWTPPAMNPRNLSVAVSRLGGLPRPAEAKFRDAPPAPAPVQRVHPKESEQVARIRGYKVESGGKTYHIYRGDLHRHTDISGDGIGDGSLMDLYRYALDAAALDFCIVSDHNMGGDAEYPWWRTQKSNDLYTRPGAFISVYGYERSVPYPDGHRNVLWLERGHRTLPVPGRMQAKAMAEDTGKLYAYLKQTDGVCTPHTSATDQGTDWSQHDDALEPVVEIFQGYHTSYEAPGAPRTVDDKTDRVHGPYKPDGFVSLALDKGYRLGFQASSDHVSTHVSYTCVLADEFSRKGLIDAIKKRHTYAATDNIVMDVRMGALGLMGDEVRTDKPGLDVVVLGTGTIDRVEVIRDGEVVHSEAPKDAAEARFHWDDPKPKKGEKASYYYVRMIQKDGQAAWASPIWVDPGN
jgi:hypothetical protein